MKKRVSQYMVEQRLPALPRQAAPPRVAVGHVRRARHRRHLAAAAGPARRHPAPVSRRARPPAWRSSRRSIPEKALVVRRIAQDLVGAARRAARPRPRLSLARAQHAHALAGRAAAAAAGHAGPLQPVRRRLRARRAVGRAAPGRHRGAAAGARPAEGVRQLAVRRRARARRDPPRRLDRRRRARPRASTAAMSSTAARPTGCEHVEDVADPPLPVRRRTLRRRRRPAHPKGWLRLAGVTRNNLHGLDVAFPLGVFTTVTGVSGSGKSSLVSQVLVELVAEQLGHAAPAGRGGRRRSWSGPPWPRSAAGSRRHGGHQAPGAGRPEADRPHAALEPRHLHRPVRPRPQAVRRDQGGARPAATTPGGSRSTSPRAAARPARAKASSWSSCSSCPASTPRARPATAPATTRRRSRSSTATRASPTCWG